MILAHRAVLDQIESAPARIVEEAETYNRMFGELAALEAHRRALRDRIVGTE